jgi:hypothetical protein
LRRLVEFLGTQGYVLKYLRVGCCVLLLLPLLVGSLACLLKYSALEMYVFV